MSGWTQEQQHKAADYIDIAYPQGRGLRGMGIALVDLACQRNELLEALKACHLQMLQSNNDSEYAQEANQLAIAAIAKAEGK